MKEGQNPFDDPPTDAGNGYPGGQVCPLDFIYERDHYSIHADLMGFTLENVEVNINNDGMSNRAKKETKERG